MIPAIELIIILFLGIIGGIIGAIVGVGGVIIIPILTFLGLSPSMAIATERFASLGQTAMTIRDFFISKQIIWKYFFPFTILMLISTLLNTISIIAFSETLTNTIIIVMMIITFIILFAKHNVGTKKIKVSKKQESIGYAILFIVTFFSGFIGGLGILKYALISIFFGSTLIQSNASQRFPWFISILFSSIILALHGYIHFTYGLLLLIGYAIGAHIGVIIELKKGNKWVKTLTIIIIGVMLVKFILF